MVNKMKKRVLVATGGGDCPGLNAVIRQSCYVPSKKETGKL